MQHHVDDDAVGYKALQARVTGIAMHKLNILDTAGSACVLRFCQHLSGVIECDHLFEAAC